MKFPLKLKKRAVTAPEAEKAQKVCNDQPQPTKTQPAPGGLRKRPLLKPKSAQVSNIKAKPEDPASKTGDRLSGENKNQVYDFKGKKADLLEHLCKKYPNVVREFIERGLKICETTNTHPGYFVKRYLDKSKQVSVKREFSAAWMEELKNVRFQNI